MVTLRAATKNIPIKKNKAIEATELHVTAVDTNQTSLDLLSVPIVETQKGTAELLYDTRATI